MRAPAVRSARGEELGHAGGRLIPGGRPSGPKPWPPGDLDERSLPLASLSGGTRLYRIHHTPDDAVAFSFRSDETGGYRFDDPAVEYGVLYAGLSLAAAMVETVLRQPDRTVIGVPDLDRPLSVLEPPHEFALVDLDGRHLRRLGATTEVIGGGDYDLSQAWSRALRGHPDAPDGLRYPCRHDPSVHAVALFPRAGVSEEWIREQGPLLRQVHEVGRVLRRYEVGLAGH